MRKRDASSSGAAFNDYIVRFDFDGDWNGRNNADNLRDALEKGFDLRAYVYYAAQETDFYYYLHYAYFHPRDPKPVGGHENDVEGVMVVVQKSDARVGTKQEGHAVGLGGLRPRKPARELEERARFGSPVLMQTLAHDAFAYARHKAIVDADPEVSTGGLRTDRDLGPLLALIEENSGNVEILADLPPDPEKEDLRTHAIVQIEPGRAGVIGSGHGALVPPADVLQDNNPRSRIIYYPGDSAETPSGEGGGEHVAYELISLTGDRDADGKTDTPIQSSSPFERGLWDRKLDDRLYSRSTDYEVVDQVGALTPKTFGRSLHGRRFLTGAFPGIGLILIPFKDLSCAANLPWGWIGDGLKDSERGRFFRRSRRFLPPVHRSAASRGTWDSGAGGQESRAIRLQRISVGPVCPWPVHFRMWGSRTSTAVAPASGGSLRTHVGWTACARWERALVERFRAQQTNHERQIGV